MNEVRLMLGDCLERMKEIESGAVDLILADLPYGTTQNKWDSVIPLDALWVEYLRIAAPTAAFVFTASQPFTSSLVVSNPGLFRHEWIWLKNRGSNFANTVREPMKEHESVLVFSRGKWTYNKQMQERTGGGLSRVKYDFSKVTQTENYGAFKKPPSPQGAMRVPSSWQKFNVEVGKHPTQKPVALMEYLIRTCAVPGMTVLDNTMGSGTTGVAALRCGCDFIGIELDPSHFETATARIDEEAIRLATPVPQFDLFAEVANV